MAELEITREARRAMIVQLREKHYKFTDIGRRFGISGVRASQIYRGKESRGGGYDPERRRAHREKIKRERPDDYREQLKRTEIRKQARAEAAETGEPVEVVYARWGVSAIPTGPKPRPIPLSELELAQLTGGGV